MESSSSSSSCLPSTTGSKVDSSSSRGTSPSRNGRGGYYHHHYCYSKFSTLMMIVLITIVTDRILHRISNLELQRLDEIVAKSAFAGVMESTLTATEEEEEERQYGLEKNERSQRQRQLDASMTATTTAQRHQQQGGGGGKAVLPNVLLIGTPKSGSDFVADWLFREGGICPASTNRALKEPIWYQRESNFFNNDQRYALGKMFYKQRFAHCFTPTRKYKFRLDATPTTILFPHRVYETYKAVKNMNKLRIIVTLREPIGRELAQYKHQVSRYKSRPDPSAWYSQSIIHKETGEIKTFEEYVDSVTIPCFNQQSQHSPLNATNSTSTNNNNTTSSNTTSSSSNFVCSSGISYYAKWLKPWFDLFDSNQILLLDYDTDIVRTSKAKRRIQDFLNSTAWRGATADATIPFHNTMLDSGDDESLPPCSAVDKLQPLLTSWDQELHELLEQQQQPHGANPGRPPMEQQPFPTLVTINNNNNNNKKESTTPASPPTTAATATCRPDFNPNIYLDALNQID